MDDLGRNHWTNWTGIGGLFAPESVDGFNRNGWTICPGIGGRIGPEYAVVACFIPKEQIQGSLTMMLSGLSARTNMGKKLMAAAGASLLFAAAS
jgi:hypothetical protein